MSQRSDEFMATRITAVRVLMTRDGSEDLVLRITARDGDHNFIVSRGEFVRLTQSLNQDAMRLSTMQKGDKPS